MSFISTVVARKYSGKDKKPGVGGKVQIGAK